MSGMRDYSDAEIDLVRRSFSGRYALRDRCFFEMALQMGLRVSEMLRARAKITFTMSAV
jgi:site-specific recombinase XerC